jgi:hypothetical protein
VIATVVLLVIGLWLSAAADRRGDWAARAAALVVAASQVVVLAAGAGGDDPGRYVAVLAPFEVLAAAALLVGSLIAAVRASR